MDDGFKIHPMVFLGVAGVLLYVGHSPSKTGGMDGSRRRTRERFDVGPDCTLTLVDDAASLENHNSDYFYHVLGQSYLDGISDDDDNADYILKDLFPECDPPFTSSVRETVRAHVVNLKLEGLGFDTLPNTEGLAAFQENWNRLISVLEVSNPNAISTNPEIYRRIEGERGAMTDQTRIALNKAYTRWANVLKGDTVEMVLNGKAYEVESFWDMVDKAEQALQG
jgi:hypothetical protein